MGAHMHISMACLYAGTLDAAWGQPGTWGHLNTLDLSSNKLTGQLPFEWGLPSRNSSDGLVTSNNSLQTLRFLTLSQNGACWRDGSLLTDDQLASILQALAVQPAPQLCSCQAPPSDIMWRHHIGCLGKAIVDLLQVKAAL